MKNLLECVSRLIKEHEEKELKSGGKFNIFSILNMETDEVRTHSTLITELLNPKGSHGLGDKPLKLFIEQMNLQSKLNGFNYSSAKAKTEESVGLINTDETEGGRIDIVVKDFKGHMFLVENKIYAPEQKNQLIRYENAYPNVPILYLTLDGKESESADGLMNKESYQCISYKEHILRWLDKCRELTSISPGVKEIINQYRNLIKKLTNQTMNQELKKEITNQIKLNLSAASEIANNYAEVHKSLIEEYMNQLCQALIKGLNKSETEEKEHWKFKVQKLYTDSVKVPYYQFYKKEWNDVFLYLRIETNNKIIAGLTLNPKKQNHIKKFQQFPQVIDLKRSYKTSSLSVLWTDNFPIDFSSPEMTQRAFKDLNSALKQGQEFCSSFFENCVSISDTINNQNLN